MVRWKRVITLVVVHATLFCQCVGWFVICVWQLFAQFVFYVKLYHWLFAVNSSLGQALCPFWVSGCDGGLFLQPHPPKTHIKSVPSHFNAYYEDKFANRLLHSHMVCVFFKASSFGLIVCLWICIIKQTSIPKLMFRALQNLNFSHAASTRIQWCFFVSTALLWTENLINIV